ncbi:hypothetical protein Barb4_05455 [Bacteroidales bacterium Barb4]|nr:hypothetical protein Barb4_05455 [Bacteroidales bacterium Barb4]
MDLSHLHGFIDFLKNVLHLRNMISHNNVVYSCEFAYQSMALNCVYESVMHKKINRVKLIHMMELIEYFSHTKTLVSNTKYYYGKAKIQQKFKDKIDLFGVKDEQNII